MRIIELLMLEICQKSKKDISSIQLIRELLSLTDKTGIGESATRTPRNLYRIVEGLVNRKLLQGSYTNAIPRERMISISEIGKAYVEKFHVIIEPFTRRVSPQVPPVIQEESRGSTEDIEALIVKELFDNPNLLTPDRIARIKRASKKIVERTRRIRKSPAKS